MDLATCRNHEWTNISHETWACTQCEETCWNCHTCQDRPTGGENRICQYCKSWTERMMDDIQRALDEPREARDPLQAIRYDRTGGSGDDTMPLGVGQELDDDEENAKIALDRGLDPIDLIRDPEAMVEIIDGWADSWAEARREQRGDSVSYLRQLILWAANTPDTSVWDEFVREVRKIRGKLIRWAGISPQRYPGPCIYCGNRTLVQEWTDNGLDDVVQCRSCRERWFRRSQVEFSHLTFIKEAHYTHPDLIVDRQQARSVLGVKADTLSKAIRRDATRVRKSEEAYLKWTREDPKERGDEPEVHAPRAPEAGRLFMGAVRDFPSLIASGHHPSVGFPVYRLGDLADLMRLSPDEQEGRHAKAE